MINGNTAVVIIDYWDSENAVESTIRNKLFDNIISTTCNIPNLKLVVKSCYERDRFTANQRIDSFMWPCDTIEAYSADQLRQYLSDKQLAINNIVIMGMHWDRCIKNRDIGWLSLHEIFPEIDVYVVEGCVLAVNNFLKNSFWPNFDRYDYCFKLHESIYKISRN